MVTVAVTAEMVLVSLRIRNVRSRASRAVNVRPRAAQSPTRDDSISVTRTAEFGEVGDRNSTPARPSRIRLERDGARMRQYPLVLP